MPENIDYKFLNDLEGGSKTNGYVPAAGVSKSGVTIAMAMSPGSSWRRSSGNWGGGSRRYLRCFTATPSPPGPDRWWQRVPPVD